MSVSQSQQQIGDDKLHFHRLKWTHVRPAPDLTAGWLLYFLTNEWEVFMIKYGWKTPTTRHTGLDNPAQPSVSQIIHPIVSKLCAISPLMHKFSDINSI